MRERTDHICNAGLIEVGSVFDVSCNAFEALVLRAQQLL